MTALLKSMLSISAATVFSRVTGYGRYMVQAAVLASTFVADAYVVSALLPTLIYELFLGGILYSIFIPVLVERMTTYGEEDARDLTSALFTVVVPLMAVLTVLGFVFAEPLVRLATSWSSANISPARAEETVDLAVIFFRIFALQMLFYGVSTIGVGVLQAHRRFFLPTFAPVFNNLVVIASFGGYWLLQDSDRTLAYYVLAGGMTVGVMAMALALVPTMWALGYKPRPRLRHPALLSTARLAGPMVVLVAASVAFQFYATYLATNFKGGPALLNYAFVIFSLPYGIFVVAVATALMPELSEKHARGDAEGYRESFSFGLRTLAFVVVPSAVGMAVLAEPLVGLLYERGIFGAQETQAVAALLAAYAVGLLGYGVYFFLVRAFYSRQNTKTPAVLNVAIFAIFAVLAYGFSRTSLGLVGVALGLSASYIILAVIGLAAMRREIKRIEGGRLLRSLAKVAAAGAVMYAVARGGTALLGTGSDFLERLLVLTVVGTTSLAAYLGTAFLLRAEELRSVVALVRRRRAV